MSFFSFKWVKLESLQNNLIQTLQMLLNPKPKRGFRAAPEPQRTLNPSSDILTQHGHDRIPHEVENSIFNKNGLWVNAWLHPCTADCTVCIRHCFAICFSIPILVVAFLIYLPLHLRSYWNHMELIFVYINFCKNIVNEPLWYEFTPLLSSGKFL